MILASSSFCWLPPDSSRARAIRVAGADVEAANPAFQRLLLGGAVQHEAAGELGQRKQRHVWPHALLHQQALGLAVLGQVDDPGVAHFRNGSMNDDFLAGYEDGSASSFSSKAANGFEEFRAARSDQAGEAEDLALAQAGKRRLRRFFVVMPRTSSTTSASTSASFIGG
jgi:hypothetical protein